MLSDGWKRSQGNPMSKTKINAKGLIQQIEKITRSRMASGGVVSLECFRDFKKKIDAPVLLIIDDDESIRSSMKRIFEQEFYEVKLAADAAGLTKILDDVTPDLILMDVGLPWLNGLELGEMLKNHKELKKIPLVFVSGKIEDSDVKKAFEIGADDYIKKPFDVDSLKRTVRTLLKLNKSGF